ncbi:helix-turn-helix domain-containing protein [Nocardia brasiliensis]|uniref:Helix-turn-helix domain-containing protein n=1 Tax=Nocardia brasiliensis TaxID=37326 RepID=A0A6G9Y0S7_NOCBR|nr:helix-turn-helix domain-containing protein [Nocardia brasiliensis]QIS06808.1 helix-turn-helix domain-containing protein [Nocardia brasiliensis]
MDDHVAGRIRLIRAIREQQGLSRQTLARRAGISWKWLSTIEQGAGNPSEKAIAQLFNGLGVGAELQHNILAQFRMNALPRAEFDAEDQAELDAHPYPMWAQHMSSHDVYGTNEQYERMFPGIKPGTNAMVWTVTDPRARELMPDWLHDARVMVQWFLTMSTVLVEPAHRDEIISQCAVNDIWEMLCTPLRPHLLIRRTLTVYDPEIERVRTFTRLVSEAHMPEARPWAVGKLVPRPDEPPVIG